MFQYTHEVILNSLTMPDGSKRVIAPAFDEKEKHGLVIKRGGEYHKKFVKGQDDVEHIIFKTEGNFGKYELLKIDATKLPTAMGIYQLSMFVKLLDPHALFDYGYPNYNSFGKHFLVGYDVVPGDDAAAIAQKLYDALKLAIDPEYAIVGKLDGEEVAPWEEGATDIAIRASHFAQRFDTLGLSIYDETSCDSCLGEYLPSKDLFKEEIAEIVVEGVEPFATGEWLQENLRFPSYPNIRYHAPGYADYPTPGVLYNQYSFCYASPRPQLGGLSGVGQDMMAFTRHIYYVPQSLAEEFEGLLAEIGEIKATNEVEVTNVDANVAAAEGGEESGN